MANDNQDFHKEMEILRNDFHQRLIAELERIIAYRALSDEKLCDTATVKELLAASHKLAGSSLTFGYKDTGILLRSFEHLLSHAIAGDKSLDPSQMRLKLGELAPAISLPSTVNKEVENARHTPSEPEETLHRNEDICICILEDDAATSETLKLGLSSFGYKVSTFTDIEALCDRARATPPDALIFNKSASSIIENSLDNTVETLRERGLNDIPMIVISPADGFQEKLLAARNGVAAFLVKPVSIPALESSLDYLLQQNLRSPYRVLLVDDDIYTLEHHRLMLERRGIMAHALADPEKTLDVIEDFHPDLLIFDLHMPLCTGIELAEIVRYQSQLVHIPIIFLSSERNENRQLLAMKTGGDDFIVKPVVEDNFVTTIKSRAQRARKLAELMTRDSLTGLLKHTEIKERLNHEYARARRNKAIVSVAMIDIDHFKKVNDTYGHQAGDVVIATLAHLLRRGLRTTDLVGRYGGEEYMVVLPDTNTQSAMTKLDSLRAEFETIVFRHKNEEFTCSFSGGVCSSDITKSVDEFVELSDRALYRAKAKGRNCIIDAKDASSPL
ncbi:MAG: diguanylate cyclase [Gammaproteobacteria bacterium]